MQIRSDQKTVQIVTLSVIILNSENRNAALLMTTIAQNLVFFIESSVGRYDISSKSGNMCINRFCIDEDAAFELSGVHHSDESFDELSLDISLRVNAASKGQEFFHKKRYQYV